MDALAHLLTPHECPACEACRHARMSEHDGLYCARQADALYPCEVERGSAFVEAWLYGACRRQARFFAPNARPESDVTPARHGLALMELPNEPVSALLQKHACGAPPAPRDRRDPSACAAGLFFTRRCGRRARTQRSGCLRRVLGADWKRYIPTADVDQDDVYRFLAARAKDQRLVTQGDGRAHLAVDPDRWTLPIPIGKQGDGWRFDTRAGADGIRTRRIGRDELAAIQAALANYDAQKEYRMTDRNGDGVLKYTQRIVSTPGKQDGL